MRRSRWILVILTLLSCLLLIHIYLDQFSFQDAQIVGAIKKRLAENVVAKQNALKKKIVSERDKYSSPTTQPQDYTQDLDDYAQRRFEMITLDNTLNKLEIPDRELPLIPLKIPGNDFIPIIGIMLIVFVLASWLNMRSIIASMNSLDLKSNAELQTLVRLHFTFTGLVGSSAANALAAVIKYLAFLFPAIALLSATTIEIYSMVSAMLAPSSGYLGTVTELVFRGVVLAVECLIIWIFSIQNITRVHEVQKLVD